MKYTIGLTGGIASGKTTVTNIFENFGINIIDADKIAKQVVSPKSDALEEIKKKFGNEIIKDNTYKFLGKKIKVLYNWCGKESTSKIVFGFYAVLD